MKNPNESIGPAGPGTLPISAIVPSPTNPRKNFDPEKISQLADTIKAQGRILQKLLVRPWPGREGVFECVDGARRRLAAIQLGLAELPVDVLELSDAQVIEIQLITGETGEPLSALEEAEGFQTALGLKDASGEACFTHRSLGQKIGCSPNHIKQRLDLLKLPADERKLVMSGRLAPRTANLIARVVGKETMAAAIKEIVYPKHRDEPLTYREAEAVIHERFMVSLQAAPFEQADATLDGPFVDEKSRKYLPQACATCPLKTGNSPEVFGEVKDKNVCTSPGCYRAKCNAAWARAAAKAKAVGQRVLTDEEAGEVFEKNSPAVQIAFSSPYVDVESKPTYRHVANEVEDKNLPTWRELLATAAEKKKIKVPTVLARDRNGKQWELVQLSLAIEAARAVGEDMFKKTPVNESMTSGARFERDAVRSTVRGTDDFAQKKKAEADATKKRLVENCLALVKLHDALSLKILGYEPITDALLHTALHHAGNDGQALFVKAFGLQTGGGDFENSDAIEAWFKTKTKSDRHAAIPILLVAPSMKWNGLKCEGFVALAESVKFDIAAIEKEAAAQLAAKGKPAAAPAPTSAAARPAGRELTEGEVEILGTMHTEGKPPRDLASRFGMSVALVKWYTAAAKKPAAPVTTDPKILAQWVKAYVKGMPIPEIARSYKVSEDDVKGALGQQKEPKVCGVPEGKFIAAKTLFVAGNSAGDVAKKLQISLPSAHNIKKHLAAEAKKKKPAASAAKGGKKK